MDPVYFTIQDPLARGGVILALYSRENLDSALRYRQGLVDSGRYAKPQIRVSLDGKDY
jgi:hypothetical protein